MSIHMATFFFKPGSTALYVAVIKSQIFDFPFHFQYWVVHENDFIVNHQWAQFQPTEFKLDKSRTNYK